RRFEIVRGQANRWSAYEIVPPGQRPSVASEPPSRDCGETEEPSPRLTCLWGELHRAPQEEDPCHGETSPNIPGSRTGKRSISSRATRAAAFRGRRPNVAPGPRSTRTTAVERRPAARVEENRLAIPPRTRAAGLAAQRRPRDRRRAEMTRP